MLRRNFLSGSFALAMAAARQGLAWPNQVPKSILEYGAKPDGKTLNTNAIQRAIDDAHQAGGGAVHVPSGMFLTGRIDLKSHVTLYLEEGCTLRGSTSLNDYDAGDAGGEGRRRHLIFAHDAEGVTLAGPGRIDGQGKNFWEPSGKTPIPPDEQWADFSSRILSPKKSGRPSPMLYFVNCRQLRIEDVRIENSPGWTLHTLNCDDVNIKGIAIKNPVVGPNTDGIDMTGCQNVLVSNCSVDTGDDAICLKSENPYGPEPRLTKNVVVTNCHLTTCCNGFKLGTSSEGGFENITFSNSVIYNDEVEFKARVISGIALEVVDGGWIDGVVVSGIQMQRTRTPVFIRLGNRKRSRDYPKQGIRGVSIDNVQASEAVLASSITGLPGMDVQDVTLSNIHVDNVLPSRPEWVGRGVPEKEAAYPEAKMFGMLPASGLYVRHARDLRLNNVEFTAPAGEARPTIIFDDVIGARVTGLKSAPVSGGMPVVQVIHSGDVHLSQVSPARSTLPENLAASTAAR
jgi:polygalacturonase